VLVMVGARLSRWPERFKKKKKTRDGAMEMDRKHTGRQNIEYRLLSTFIIDCQRIMFKWILTDTILEVWASKCQPCVELVLRAVDSSLPARGRTAYIITYDE